MCAGLITAIFGSSVTARYLKIYSTAGDNAYSVGELQAFGSFSPSAVPEPGAIMIFGAGLLGLAGIARKNYFAEN